MQTIDVISQERLKIEVKLLLSANGKSYILRRLAQRRMTLSGLEWPFHASRAIFAVVELLVLLRHFNWPQQIRQQIFLDLFVCLVNKIW